MVWQVLAAQAVVGGVSKGLSALANKKALMAKESAMEIELHQTLHANNVAVMQKRAASAIRGNQAGSLAGVNAARKDDFSAINSFALQRASMRAETEAGFINAAAGTSIDAVDAGLAYNKETGEEKKTAGLESLASADTEGSSDDSGIGALDDDESKEQFIPYSGL